MIEILEAGLVPFPEGEVLQRRLAAERARGERRDTLILLEHPAVVTCGRRRSEEDLKVPRKELEERGIAFCATDRGGKLTYHGPGQLVAYFIFSLKGQSIPHFVRAIEEVLIRTLGHLGVEGSRDRGFPGVWVKREKIAALGLRVEREVTRHGFALNVDCDLTPFQLFSPCGMTDRGVTSLEKILATAPPMGKVRAEIIHSLSQVFDKPVSFRGRSYFPFSEKTFCSSPASASSFSDLRSL